MRTDPESYDLEELRGSGTVWIAADPFAEVPVFTGYWDRDPDGPPALLEQGPGWSSPEDAVRWGRQRSPRVLIRFERGEYWWAGEAAESPVPGVEGVYRLDTDA